MEENTTPCVTLHEYLTFCLLLITVKLSINMQVNLNGIIINILRLVYCFGPTDVFCLLCILHLEFVLQEGCRQGVSTNKVDN